MSDRPILSDEDWWKIVINGHLPTPFQDALEADRDALKQQVLDLGNRAAAQAEIREAEVATLRALLHAGLRFEDPASRSSVAFADQVRAALSTIQTKPDDSELPTVEQFVGVDPYFEESE